MKVRGFRALLPDKAAVKEFSALPYDVVTDEDVRGALAEGRGLFFEVIRTDSLYSGDIYAKARQNLDAFIDRRMLTRDEAKSFYVYQEIFGEISQTGLVATVNVDEYINGSVKRHERTLKEKEIDRINNFYACRADTEPIFLFQRENARLKEIIDRTKAEKISEYDFVSEDNVRHILWKINDESIVSEIEEIFCGVDSLYIADGHHRTASAIEVAKRMRNEQPDYTGSEEFNYFMAVIFFEEELKVLPYNRVIRDISRYDMDTVMEGIRSGFEVEECADLIYPDSPHTYMMLVDSKPYMLRAKEELICENDPVASLDTVILHKNIIEPLFKITDIKNEDEIAFIGGSSMERRLNELKDGNIVFLMYPTRIEQIRAISDSGSIMPPKSTWFEPKLRSGLFIHEL